MNGFYYDFINKIITLIIKTHFAFKSLHIYLKLTYHFYRTGFFSVVEKKKFISRSVGHHKHCNIISHLIFNLIEHPNYKDLMLKQKKWENIQIKFKSDRSHYKTLIDRFSASYSLLLIVRPPYYNKNVAKTENDDRSFPYILLPTYCYKISNWVLSFIFPVL